jgi:MFS transporter, DHA3 family, macrolide efflux protein
MSHEDETQAPRPIDSTQPGAQAQPPGEKVNYLTVLRNANFRNLWLGQVVSQIGDYFAFLALTVVVSGFSDNAEETTFAVTGMMLAFTLPRLLFGLLAGVFVDRWDRRRTMLVSDFLRSGITLMMVPAVLSGNLWAMYALAFAMSAVGTLFNPAKGALIPALVPAEHLISANSLSQTTHMLAILIGPALAGSTLALAGAGNEWVAFIVDSASYLVSAGMIWLVRSPVRAAVQAVGAAAAQGAGAVRQVWLELLVGLKALFLNRSMATLAVIFAFVMLGIGAINVLWVVWMKEHFGYVDTELAWRFSVLDIGFGAGMIASNMVAGNLFSNVAPKWFLVVSLAGTGATLVAFGFMPDYWWLFADTLLMGVFVAPINTGIMTLMQIVVPNRQLGRVGGGFTTLGDTASVISVGGAGVAAAAMGIPMVFALAGVICAAMGIASWVLLPSITLKDKVPDDDVVPTEGSETGQQPVPLFVSEPHDLAERAG